MSISTIELSRIPDYSNTANGRAHELNQRASPDATKNRDKLSPSSTPINHYTIPNTLKKTLEQELDLLNKPSRKEYKRITAQPRIRKFIRC